MSPSFLFDSMKISFPFFAALCGVLHPEIAAGQTPKQVMFGVEKRETIHRRLGVPGGTVHIDRCVPGHNDFPVTTEATEDDCFARCAVDCSDCFTVDWNRGNGVCCPSRQACGSSAVCSGYNMWSKDGVRLLVLLSGLLVLVHY